MKNPGIYLKLRRPVALGICCLLLHVSTLGQHPQNHDSLYAVASKGGDDAQTSSAWLELARLQKSYDTAILYGQRGMEAAQKSGNASLVGEAAMANAMIHSFHMNFAQSIKASLRALEAYSQAKDTMAMAWAYLSVQGNYREAHDYGHALQYAQEGYQLAGPDRLFTIGFFTGQRMAPVFLAEKAQTFLLMNQPDSAMHYAERAIREKTLVRGYPWAFPYYIFGLTQHAKKQLPAALNSLHFARSLCVLNGLDFDTIQINTGISSVFVSMDNPDSTIFYANRAYSSWNRMSDAKNLLEALNNLYTAYERKGNKDSVIKYMSLKHHLEDSIFTREKERELAAIIFNEKIREQESAAEKSQYRKKIQVYVLLGGIGFLLVLAAILLRSNRQRLHAKERIEEAFHQLQSTQAQLVQSEKMASLGELTAGIAHEIQNPLNFVNNFSELNKELIEELQEELKKGDIRQASSIADNLKDNEEKINLHGRRADGIVKSMLQHSRASSSTKELTDVNKLVDEYVRLAYHGYRARKKDFNVKLDIETDPAAGSLPMVAQDIGRVLLNLLNNAFQAVEEKSRTAGQGYQPTVTVSTTRSNQGVEIRVEDNGPGIPDNIQDKIFQPFFTTKPAGQGTGLGLSLSYDIITNGHGGKINLDTNSSAGTVFSIQLKS